MSRRRIARELALFLLVTAICATATLICAVVMQCGASARPQHHTEVRP